MLLLDHKCMRENNGTSSARQVRAVRGCLMIFSPSLACLVASSGGGSMVLIPSHPTRVCRFRIFAHTGHPDPYGDRRVHVLRRPRDREERRVLRGGCFLRAVIPSFFGGKQCRCVGHMKYRAQPSQSVGVSHPPDMLTSPLLKTSPHTIAVCVRHCRSI